MATEFTPELDEQVLEALRRKIKDQEAQQISEAQGMASSRNLTGSTFEATRIGLANKSSMDAQTDAMVNLAVQRANMAREERLVKEGQEFQAGETQKGRDFQEAEGGRIREFTALQARLSEQFQSLEEEKQRAFAKGENKKARQFEAQQQQLNREYQQALAERQSRDAMMSAGIQGGAGLLGNLIGRGGGLGGLGGLFGGGMGATGSAISTGGGAGGMIGSGAGGLGAAGGGLFGGFPLGLGALSLAGSIGISSGLGQLMGRGLFSGDRNRTGARRGAQIGSLLMPGMGGMFGSVLGGGAHSLGVNARNVFKGSQTTVRNIGRSISSVFCFDGNTAIETNQGEMIPIYCLTLGEVLRDGGVIESIRVSKTDDGSVYRYKGVTVTGFHAVKEDGKWIRVKDSKEAIPLPGNGVVFSLVTSTHRIFIDGIEFADEHETDDPYMSLDKSLEVLNKAAA